MWRGFFNKKIFKKNHKWCLCVYTACKFNGLHGKITLRPSKIEVWKKTKLSWLLVHKKIIDEKNKYFHEYFLNEFPGVGEKIHSIELDVVTYRAKKIIYKNKAKNIEEFFEAQPEILLEYLL